ncbi:hypothetical protein [Nocardioides campestrisoli]|uniref:hypothetical protein n=1 Tax=Nocardioides campestrisoli TaxID=2736757 RepID=UPI0015E6C378|nr:hypothetical protein [Nocardioides campestrisoli]
MTAQPPSDSYGASAAPAHDPGSDHLTDVRSRGAIALVLGLVGALGTGALSTGLTTLIWSIDSGWLSSPTSQWIVLGVMTAAFGAGSWVLALEPARSRDQVAVPLARAAQVAAAIAVLAGVLTVLGALITEL